MKWILCLSILALAATLPAFAEPQCRADRIAHITQRQHKMPGYGPEIRTQAGHNFYVLGQDLVDPRGWKDGQRLKVCAESEVPKQVIHFYEITDEDRGGERLPVSEKK